MGTTNENPRVDGKTGDAAHDDGADTRDFIATHNVTKVARKAVPGSGEESADLLRDDAGDRSKSGT